MWIGGVRVIILDEQDRMLLVKQQHGEKEIWMVPGGGIEAGESSVGAAVREVKEETGLDVKIGRLVWHVEEVSDRGQRFVNFFTGSVTGGSLQLGADPEFDESHQVLREARFMTREELDGIPILYPEYLRDEFWQFLKEDHLGYDAFKMREE